jgi:hypothetical protein
VGERDRERRIVPSEIRERYRGGRGRREGATKEEREREAAEGGGFNDCVSAIFGKQCYFHSESNGGIEIWR